MPNEALLYSSDGMKKLGEDLLHRVEKAALRTSPRIAAATLDFFADTLPNFSIRTDPGAARQGAVVMRYAITHHALNTAQMLREL